MSASITHTGIETSELPRSLVVGASLATAGCAAVVGIGLVQGWAAFVLLSASIFGITATAVNERARLALPRWAVPLASIATIYAALRVCGPLAVHLHPLVFVSIAYFAAAKEKRVAASALGMALMIEWLSFVGGTAIGIASGELDALVIRSGFVAAFAIVYRAFHAAELIAQKSHARSQEREAKRLLLRRSEELRLTVAKNSTSDDRGGDRLSISEDLTTSAVDACVQTAMTTLELLRSSLDAGSALVLWARPSDGAFQVRENLTDHTVNYRPIRAGSGVLGSLHRTKASVSLAKLDANYSGLTFYTGTTHVGSLVASPIVREGQVIGAVVIDRKETKAFTREQIAQVQSVADQLGRVAQNERLFIEIEQSKYELGQFYQASRALSSQTSLKGVFEAVLDSIRPIAAYEMAALTLVRKPKSRPGARAEHEIVAVDGAISADMIGHRFGFNRGLVSMVTKRGMHLPADGKLRNGAPIVFDDATTFKSARSLMVLPLIVQDQTIGTLVLATSTTDAFPAERRRLLEVISNQAAVAIQNARNYEQMQKLATTDGLTGLLNRRTFLERLERGMARSERSDRPSTLILTDIDFFKKVNDTHGHLAGDEVLRQVSAVLQGELRKTDVVGRYGGEEFIIFLEDTDIEGGVQMAERLRHAVSMLRFESDAGEFGVTLSLGVSRFSEDSKEQDGLIECADQALYACKERGRNQTLAYCAL